MCVCQVPIPRLARCIIHVEPWLQGPRGSSVPVDDVRGAFAAMARIPVLAAAVATAIVSMSLFNWFGVCITISLSGVTRLTIDACRTLLVWAVSLLLGWEKFNSLQLLGFFILVCGATLYNELITGMLQPQRSRTPSFSRPPAAPPAGLLTLFFPSPAKPHQVAAWLCLCVC